MFQYLCDFKILAKTSRFAFLPTTGLFKYSVNSVVSLKNILNFENLL
jgi:hypothetical protein